MGSRVRQLADEALNVTVWSHHEQSVSEHDGSVFISHDQKNTEKKKQKTKKRGVVWGKLGRSWKVMWANNSWSHTILEMRP